MSKAALESGLEEVIGDIEDESSDAEFLVTTGDLLRELNSNTELRARLPKKDRKVWDELVGLLEEADEVLGVYTPPEEPDLTETP